MNHVLAHLAHAVRAGDQATIEAYLAAGGDPTVTDWTGVTLLHLAAQRRQVAIAAALIQAGADVNARDRDGRTPLYEALADWVPGGPGVVAGDFRVPTPDAPPDDTHMPELVRLLIGAGAAVNTSTDDYAGARSLLLFEPPLALAAKLGDVTVLRELLAAGAGVNARDVQR